MIVCGKGKEDNLREVADPSVVIDPKYRVWKAEDYTIMSWLITQ